MTELHYEISGPADGPVVVLGPSMGTTLHMWQPMLDAVGERWRVIRFDHRGHGGTPGPAGPYTIEDLGRDVLDLLDTLDLARVSYCGLSLGGMIGAWLGVHAPERIDRLALLCTAAYLPPAEGWLTRAATVRATGGTESVAEAVLARWFTAPFLASRVEERMDEVAQYRKMLTGIAAEGYAGCCEAIASMDQRADLPRIGAPTLVVSGLADPSTPPEFGEEIALRVPGARFVVVEQAAHLASVERPAEVGRLVAAHFAGAAPTAGRGSR
jgi:3-oxoadipate enol-lactonase